MVSTIEESIAHSIKYQLSKYKDSYDFKLPLQVISCFLAGGMVSTALLCIDNPGKYSQEEFLSYIANPVTSNYFVKK